VWCIGMSEEYGITEVKSPRKIVLHLGRGYRLTYENGKWYVVPPGYNVYLGWQVSDVGSKGYSSPEEVLRTIEEIEEDYKAFRSELGEAYAKAMLNRRTNRLCLIVIADGDFQAMGPEVQAELINKINDLRVKYGLRPWRPSRRLLSTALVSEELLEHLKY